MIDLSRLLQSDRMAPVTPDIDFAQFKKDVAHNAACVNSDDVVLFETSSYKFLVGVMAVLQAGARLSLPPNDAEKTLASMSGTRLHVELGGEGEFEFRPLDPETSILDFYTSGSTGESKCVRKTLRQIENEITVLQETWGDVIDGHLVLATVSHQHIYGMLFKVLWPICAGRPFYDEMFEYWEHLVPHVTAETVIVSSPAHLTRYPELGEVNTPKMIFSSGGPLPLDAALETQQIFNQTPMEVFGSTETGGVAYRQQTGPSIPWRPFDGVETTSDEDGVLSIRSSYLADENWYEMSDRIEFLDDNRFMMKGRIDRIVKVEGKRVSLPEVEAVLCDLDLVEAAAALITPDARQSLSAVVVLSAAGQEKLGEVGEFRMGRFLRSVMKGSLDQAALPRRWRFVDEIPVNSQGKRLMADLLRLY
ncbi:AMP-binding protein [Terasakiella sp. A23]|uniref:AMP-binding protein n=1 Tax=Terasakiella sp. FCG-A23 TaxID=3080561 RepID=UPI0029557F1C|nr:AMP-binding protein [Terasakiella sp. A23]MDV7341024.1 AMP-binding protein [Terasakiella sp. A23]